MLKETRERYSTPIVDMRQIMEQESIDEQRRLVHQKEFLHSYHKKEDERKYINFEEDQKRKVLMEKRMEHRQKCPTPHEYKKFVN